SDPSRARLPQHGDAGDPRRDLLQQLQPFAGQAVFELHESGRVATRLCQTFDIAVADRIDALCEYDWHGPCRLQHVVVPPTPARIISGLSATSSAASHDRCAKVPTLQR